MGFGTVGLPEVVLQKHFDAYREDMQYSSLVDASRKKVLIDVQEVSGDEAAAVGKHLAVAAMTLNYQMGPSSCSAFTNLFARVRFG